MSQYFIENISREKAVGTKQLRNQYLYWVLQLKKMVYVGFFLFAKTHYIFVSAIYGKSELGTKPRGIQCHCIWRTKIWSFLWKRFCGFGHNI